MRKILAGHLSDARFVVVLIVCAIAHCIGASAFAAEQIVRPLAGGTIADGGTYGPFDGTADLADWSFNESSFEGAVTLIHQPPPDLEQRCVFEFKLTGLTILAPLTAELNVTVRGAARFPAEAATVEFYAYQGDLVESLADYNATPIKRVGRTTVVPFQNPTQLVLNVSNQVNALRAAGAALGVRIQIAPQSPDDSLQVFLDVIDSDPNTQPFLRLIDRVPGDGNADRLVDLLDAALILDCLQGPGVPRKVSCAIFDFDLDGDVDVTDYAQFETARSTYGL